MATQLWKAGEDVHEIVRKLVGANHPDLALVVDEIVVIFRDKAGKSGGRVNLGSARKVAPAANAIGNTDYKFVLEIGADLWEYGLDTVKREALLDYLLCHCICDEDEQTGDPKCSIARPDVIAFKENVERYGLWYPAEEDIESEDEEGGKGRKGKKSEPNISIADLFGSN